MREKPLIPWIVAEESGKVVAGHCNCVAGLGESCSHVASLLWVLEVGVRLRDSMTVTQKKAYWVLPTSVKEVPYAPLSHINFLGRSGSLATLKVPHACPISSPSPSSSLATVPVLDSSSSVYLSPYSKSSSSSSPSASSSSSCSVSSSPSPHSSLPPTCSSSKRKIKDLSPPFSEELEQLFSSLSQCFMKPVILALVRGYSSRYVPNSLSLDMPSPLSDLYKAEYLSSSYYELLQVAQATEVLVTPTQALAVGEKTRSQRQSRLWH